MQLWLMITLATLSVCAVVLGTVFERYMAGPFPPKSAALAIQRKQEVKSSSLTLNDVYILFFEMLPWWVTYPALAILGALMALLIRYLGF